jgi:AcrR family transcriptional regulator
MIAAAERIFAECGIDRVTLSDLNKAAGQRNSSALHYHFGSRENLLQAILDKHRPGLERARHAFLDGLEESGQIDYRSLAEALVRPAAAKLEDRDGGPHYLRIMAQIHSDPIDSRLAQAIRTRGSDVLRLYEKLRELRPELPSPLNQHRTALISRLLFDALAEFSRKWAARSPASEREREIFISNLIDCIAALMEIPMSQQTENALSMPESGDTTEVA